MKALTLAFGLLLVAPARGWPSVILQASEIASVRIVSAEPEPWRSVDGLERRRKVILDLSVERVLKGTLQMGARMKVVALQAEPVGRIFAVAGPWSGQAVERELRYLIFAKDATLADEALLRVADEKEATDDV